MISALFAIVVNCTALTVTPNGQTVIASCATPTPVPTPSPSPTPTATPSPTPTPSPTLSPVVYAPPAGSYPYFPTSPFVATIAPSPQPNPSSSAWVAHMTASNGPIWTNVTLFSYKTPNGSDNNEIAFPIYLDHAGSNTPVKIHCTAGFGGKTPCSIEGMKVYVDSRMTPQNGGCPPTSVCKADNHWALIDTADGREIDAWQAQWPPVNGVLTVAWGGYCDLAGNGFTAASYHGPSWNAGCQALAAHAPQSVGPIRPADLIAALADPVHGHLPAALSTVYVCPGPGPLPAPFTGNGDGKCAGNAPEGAHWAIDMHDADVDALHLAPILAVIVRTADIDHYGAFIVDSASTTNSGGQMDLNVISSRAYTSFGLADPWPGVLAEAVKEGQTRFSDPDRYGVSFLIPSAVAAKIVFL